MKTHAVNGGIQHDQELFCTLGPDTCCHFPLAGCMATCNAYRPHYASVPRGRYRLIRPSKDASKVWQLVEFERSDHALPLKETSTVCPSLCLAIQMLVPSHHKIACRARQEGSQRGPNQTATYIRDSQLSHRKGRQSFFRSNTLQRRALQRPPSCVCSQRRLQLGIGPIRPTPSQWSP